MSAGRGGWQAYDDRAVAARDALRWLRDMFGWEVAALAEPRGDGWQVAATVPDEVDPDSILAGGVGSARPFAALPLTGTDGAVVAMVLAFGGRPVEGPEAELAGRLLASLVAWPRAARRGTLKPSGVVGRARFLEMVAVEDRRCEDEGAHATVLVVDLPRSRARGSSQLVAGTARDLAAVARGSDLVGRLGPARLAVLAPGLSADVAPSVAERLRERLGAMGHVARMSWCSHEPEIGLGEALDQLLTQSGRRDARFLVCGECGRRGAYVATGHGVLRCKYCRASVEVAAVSA
jgi:GGDEF domain-containing protein